MIVTAALALSLLGQDKIKWISDPGANTIMLFTDPRVDVYARSAPVAKVLESIAKQCNRRVAWTSRADPGLVTAAFINAPLSTVADRVFQPTSTGWWLLVQPQYLVVDRIDLPIQKRVTYAAKDMDVRDALREVMKRVDLSYTVDTKLQGRVSVDVVDMPILAALKQMLAPIGATVRIEGGIYNMVMAEGGPVDLDRPAAPFSCTGETLFSALSRLGRRNGVAFEAADDVDLLSRRTVSVSGLSLGAAIERVLGPGYRAEARGWRVMITRG